MMSHKDTDNDFSDSDTATAEYRITGLKRSNSSNGGDSGCSPSLNFYDLKEKTDDKHADEEFVCVIRPASTSSPHSINNLHLLSAASMVAHDSQQRSPIEERRGSGSGSPSDGSNFSGVPNSSLTTEQGTKNSTSSEDRSEDNSAGSEDNNNGGSEDTNNISDNVSSDP